MLLNIGRFEEGEKFLLESIKRRIEKHGENHPHIGSQYENLGDLYRRRGDSVQANYYYRRGLAVKKSTGASINVVIISLNSVAGVEMASGNFDEAKALLDEAWQLLEDCDMVYRYDKNNK